MHASQEELYSGCKKFTKLAFNIHLVHLKCLGKWSNKIFYMLLDLLKEAFPETMTDLPSCHYEAKKLMNRLGIEYYMSTACPNDCTSHWGCDKKEPFVKHIKSLGGLSRKMIQPVIKKHSL